ALRLSRFRCRRSRRCRLGGPGRLVGRRAAATAGNGQQQRGHRGRTDPAERRPDAGDRGPSSHPDM
ncbi:MAG: hypothetical protein AVDCRST_MAG29-120, partial [uncultured Nocardioidaceae bacterium]